MNKIITHIISAMLIGVSCLANADDIDIFSAEVDTDANILFIMDMSGSMKWDLTDTQTIPVNPADSRKNILQSALQTVLSDPTLVGVNIGMSTFSGDTTSNFNMQGANISYPIAPIDDVADTVLDRNPLFHHKGTSYLPVGGGVTSREYVSNTIPSTWTPHGGTPIVDAIYEAALYFRGDAVDGGNFDPSYVRSAHPSSYTGLLENQTTLDLINTRSCGLAECNTFASCDSSSPIIGSVGVSCGPTVAACQAANPTYYGCSLNSGTTAGHYRRGPCLRTNDAGTCEAYGPDVWVPASSWSYVACRAPTTTYTCPTSVTTLVGSAQYKSPITKECSSNTVILLSDGEPTLNNTASKVSTLIGSGYAHGCDSGTDIGKCGPELTHYLNNVDQSSSVDGDQKITTHTIGLALSDPSAEAYLRSLATQGGGDFLNASSAGALVSALRAAVFSGTTRARTFSSPTYTPNPSSLMTHGEYVYVPVFDRGFGKLWPGNLKKFKRSGGKLIDANGVIATDALGGLKDDAKDFWATVATTHVVESGGAANKINPAQRISGAIKVFTDNGLTGTSASFRGLNDTLPNSKFGTGVTTPLKRKLVSYILGLKDDGTARHHMGDIVHSKPVFLSYGGKQVVFIGTNEGYLHAIDNETGKELFAFMPSELLKNIKKQYNNDVAGNHIYGVDGEITLWHDDKNSNRIVDHGEKAYLYFGLRRGGKSYFAIDVSNRTSPQLKWKINNHTSGFSDLGFTWSQPVITTMKYKKGGTVTSTPEPILIFGGGYVDDHAGELENSGTGSDVYVVDALTGEMRWKSPSGTIQYAVPSSIRALDVDRNGSVDRLYFGDTGGNIWRVDFTSTNLSSAVINKFASLGSVASPATERRRFFAEPDVALFKHKGKFIMSVSIGSGERPSPLDDAGDDHFFVLFDKNAMELPTTSASTIDKSDLADATSSPALNIFTSGKKGWYIDLVSTNGEKVLSRAMTYDNKVIFSSFGSLPPPPSGAPVNCSYKPSNEARLYVLDLLTGGAAIDLDGDSTISNADKSKEQAVGEIPGPAQIIFNNLQGALGGSCAKDDCVRPDEISVGKGHNTRLPPSKALKRVYWLDR